MTAKSRDSGSDLARIDAHENGPADYAHIAELTDEDFARGTIEVNGAPLKRGRPAPNGAKKQVTLRLDPDLLGRRLAGPCQSNLA